jgi:hypothetical protein
MTTNHKNEIPGLIPDQEVGSQMDIIESVHFPLEQEAIAFYEIAKKRLLDVNNWATFSAIKLSTFSLIDQEENILNRTAKEGDYLRIDIPGPGPGVGNGYDWVYIERIEETSSDNEDHIAMRVRPTNRPKGAAEDVAHFLKDSATSTFVVKRTGNIVFAEEHGRNEVPNTETDHALDNLRNTIVGWSAAIGMSYPQWKSLVKGLVSTN